MKVTILALKAGVAVKLSNGLHGVLYVLDSPQIKPIKREFMHWWKNSKSLTWKPNIREYLVLELQLAGETIHVVLAVPPHPDEMINYLETDVVKALRYVNYYLYRGQRRQVSEPDGIAVRNAIKYGISPDAAAIAYPTFESRDYED